MNDAAFQPQVPIWIRTAARGLLRVMGWRVFGSFQETPKCVVVAQHTSNWDAVFSILGALALGVRARWLGKHELFSGGRGVILRFFGGIPVYRNEHTDLVKQVTQHFVRADIFVLFVTPEATRKRAQYWKTGFYYIAMAADVPIVQGHLDYKEKCVGPGKVLYPSGDIHADMDIIRTYFEGVQPKYPHNAAPIRLSSSADYL